jgi:hypothetical protein
MIFLFGLKFLPVKELIFNSNSKLFQIGGEADLIWQGPSWYGTMFEGILKTDLGSDAEVDKIKVRFFT